MNHLSENTFLETVTEKNPERQTEELDTNFQDQSKNL